MKWVNKQHEGLRPAYELYVGRGFHEALACKTLTKGRLFIVSAGLGLIEDQTKIPTYDLTIAKSSANVANRVVGEDFSQRHWWSAVSDQGFNKDGISGLIRRNTASLFCISLPSTYLEMVMDDLGAIPIDLIGNVRIFSSEEGRRLLPEKLMHTWMPYDGRLDGADSPIPGTKADFSQRAMHHFLQHVAPRGGNDSQQDSELVLECLKSMNHPRQPNRIRMTDTEIVSVMNRDFDVVGGTASKMLTHLRRGLGIACEQSRFAQLFRDLKTKRTRAK